MNTLNIRRAAILGAGVMGAQIAAHLANANVPVILFDLAAGEGRKNAIVERALAGLKKMQPAALASRDKIHYIDAANYDEHLARLSECDLIIEAIAERMDWKNDLYARIAPHIAPTAILASNTSGLSINTLSDTLPAALRGHFCGIHFFNPPRYMPLVEIIATRHTEPATLDALESWLTTRLGKGVIRALDTPNFIANRIGIFSILCVMHHTAAFGLGFDEADALTGPLIGRPKSATFRTGDVVGLDTLAHVINTMRDTLADDPWHRHFATPAWMAELIAAGRLGQKTRGGIFRKNGKVFEVIDPASAHYREQTGAVSSEVAAILKERDAATRFAALRHCSDRQAKFLWAVFRDLFHYCAVQLENVADNARDLDFALRWGFGWAEGPFETWQSAGWGEIAQAIAADIASGKTLSDTPLPAWVLETGRQGVHGAAGSWSARRQADVPRTALPVYARQLFPEAPLGAALPTPARCGETLFENDGVRLWRLPEQDGGVGILSFKTRMHAIGDAVLNGTQAAIELATRELDALVIWHDAPFAVGADLKEISARAAAGDTAGLGALVERFQKTTGAIKYAPIPVVAAVEGMALGGGCEFAMHAARRVLALESQLGLVEVGVGLIPAGGGCKELALRAARWAGASATPAELMGFLQPAFMNVAMGKMSKSAVEAINMGFTAPTDTIRFHPRELLYVALREARALAEAGYAPPHPARAVPVAGRGGIAMLEMTLVNMQEGGMISGHDYRVSRAVAVALCGGEVETGSLVDEAWLLGVEKQLFLDLLATPATQARIAHMLATGKPLRN